jgi:propanol-preferring alcohol dehydrogenase
MQAMVLKGVSLFSEDPAPLVLSEVPEPVPRPGEILIRVSACGVCHTELDEIEGRTPPPAFPIIPGHQVVGRVARLGEGAAPFRPGDRVGVGWIHNACGVCEACRSRKENLCARFVATGRDVNGGYAEWMTVPAPFAHPIPEAFTDGQAAPLLCAGAIGWRSLRLAGVADGQNLGLTGFGASGHLVLQTLRHRFGRVKAFVFARSEPEREFARNLGAFWAGATDEAPPEQLHAVIDTTPAWKPVVEALKHLLPGGTLVVNAIRKEEADKAELLKLDYPAQLWMEKKIQSVANVTRRDISEFLAFAAGIPLRPEVVEYPLAEANRALGELKTGKIRGAKVLRIG